MGKLHHVAKVRKLGLASAVNEYVAGWKRSPSGMLPVSLLPPSRTLVSVMHLARLAGICPEKPFLSKSSHSSCPPAQILGGMGPVNPLQHRSTWRSCELTMPKCCGISPVRLLLNSLRTWSLGRRSPMQMGMEPWRKLYRKLSSSEVCQVTQGSRDGAREERSSDLRAVRFPSCLGIGPVR